MMQGQLNDVDIAIVGSGIAGATLAHKLSAMGHKVVVLEAGPAQSRAAIFDKFTTTHKLDLSAPYPNTPLAPRPDHGDQNDQYLKLEGGENLHFEYLRLVGGTTWHWAGVALRLLPSEFRLRSDFGQTEDWPIGYDELEPYYSQAEREIGVAGSDDLGAWRSEPFPMPPMPYSYAETTVIEALQKRGFKFAPRPTARNSVAYDGRPKCQGHSNCSPICPIGAQYAAITHVEKARNAGAFIAAETLVTRINLDSSRNVETLTCRRADGSSFQLSAKMYVLAANGIETPKLMLSSASERAPGGVGNAHDNVGRYFMDHPGVLFRAMMPVPVYASRGPDSSNIFTLNRDGAFRKERAGYTVSIHNRLPIHGLADKLLKEGHRPPALYEALRDRTARMIEFDGHFELLPHRSNRVRIDPGRPDSSGMPGLSLHYEVDDYTHAAVRHFHQLAQQMCDALDADLIEISPIFAHHHLMGTTRMGQDPKISVVDENCRVHGHQNLFVAGSSVFTTGGTANPTLTIAALSLRLASRINSVLGSK